MLRFCAESDVALQARPAEQESASQQEQRRIDGHYGQSVSDLLGKLHVVPERVLINPTVSAARPTASADVPNLLQITERPKVVAKIR